MLKLGTIKVPDIVVCENGTEAKQCREKLVPYIIRPKGMTDEQLVKAVLFRFLQRKFPRLNWALLGFSNRKVNVNLPRKIEVSAETRCWHDGEGGSSGNMDVTPDGEYRGVVGGSDEVGYDIVTDTTNVDDYISKEVGWDVDVEQLQELKVLPTFMDDIADAVKRNAASIAWADGWNKKLGIANGTFQGGTDAPNLMILDVSGSIPSGVAYTMVTLIDSLRTQANADLIITSRRSQYWKCDEDLPTITQLNSMVGGCNERRQFYKILEEHVFNKHWGNVIVFGDQDAPGDKRLDANWRYFQGHPHDQSEEGKVDVGKANRTHVDNLLCFHTYDSGKVPGYGLWVEEVCGKVPKKIDTKWCRYFR